MNRFDQMTPEQEEALKAYERKLRAQSYPYISLKEGRFVCDGVDIADTTWIVHADSAVTGFVRWEGGRPVEGLMVSILNPPQRPSSFADRTKWAKSPRYNGLEDPWKAQHELPLQNLETGALTVLIADNKVTKKLVRRGGRFPQDSSPPRDPSCRNRRQDAVLRNLRAYRRRHQGFRPGAQQCR
jgi:hypothetical protein